MSRDKQLFATTHLDTQGEFISEEALQDLLDSSKNRIVPIIMNHDPRSIPFGRTLDTELVELEDGHKGLLIEIEYFDSPEVEFTVLDKEVRVHNQSPGTINIGADITFRDDKSVEVLKELSNLSGAELGYMGKKAEDPLSFLTIEFALIAAGGIAFKAFIEGFFKKMGEDGWSKFKEILKHPRGEERLLVLDCNVCSEKEGEDVQVKIVLSNPYDDLDGFKENALSQIDKKVLSALKDNDKIAYIVYIYENGTYKFSHAVSRKGLPMFPEGTRIEFPDLTSKGLSFEGPVKLHEPANTHLDDRIKNNTTD